ncbi:MAG: thioredoxin [Acidobacteriota bacterium]|nr:MAG: thioredoxin [Acidobacteriota bacterium]
MTVEAFTDASWETDVLSSKLPVVVDFWADWCAPCKIMAPTIEALARELDGRARVGKLNVDENSVVSDRYEIRGIPTVMIFENGEVIEQVVGVTSKEYLAELIDEHLERIERLNKVEQG